MSTTEPAGTEPAATEPASTAESPNAPVEAPPYAPAPVPTGVGRNPVHYGQAPNEPRTNTLALLSFIFCLLGGLLGIVFGHIALSQIKRTGESGRGLAIAGLVIGYGWIGLYLSFFVVAFTVSSLRGAI